MPSLHSFQLAPPVVPPTSLVGKKVTLCVSGSVAAYKAVLLARSLLFAGAEVQVVMTSAATQFVGVTTFSALTKKSVFVDMVSSAGERHVQLAEQSDLIVIAPATADCIARAAGGRAEDLLSALLLCATCPVLCALAMHPRMYAHPIVQENIARLKSLCGWHFAGPDYGPVASGDVGLGRMIAPEFLAQQASVLLGAGVGEWSGRHIVVTAGPTSEAIDPVRALTNQSSGKMGFSLAAAAAARGARVTLIAGPVHLKTPDGVERIDVISALEMQAAVKRAVKIQHDQPTNTADALLMCAAVADYRPRSVSSEKQKRNASTHTLELVANPDILAEVGQLRGEARPYLLGFALETVDQASLIERARTKLRNKKVDAIVANRAQDALGTEFTRAVIVTEATETSVRGIKRDVAEQLLDFLSQRWQPEDGSDKALRQ